MSPTCTLLPPCSSLESPGPEALVTPSQESDASGTPSVEDTAASMVDWEVEDSAPAVAPENMNDRRKMALFEDGDIIGATEADKETEGVKEEDGVTEGVFDGVTKPSHTSPEPHTDAGVPHSTEPP